MQNMNTINTINMIQQQINQFIIKINGIEEKINMISNSNNYMNQNNFNPMNNINNLNNDLNMMNLNNFNFIHGMNSNLNIMNSNNFNSSNNSLNSNSYKNVIFRLNERGRKGGFFRPPVMINYKDDDLISDLIQRFRNKANYNNESLDFIFNAKKLNNNLTAKESGITHYANIFVVDTRIIIFKISGMKNLYFPFLIRIQFSEKVSDIVDSFVSESGLENAQILKFVYNSKLLNKNISIEEAGLKNKSEIFVCIKNQLDYIYIYFQSINKDNMISNEYIKIECLKTEKIDSLLKRYKYKTDNIDKSITFLFNSEKIDDYDKRVEEFGLKNKSIIIADFKKPEE